jgi:hypothetical protein
MSRQVWAQRRQLAKRYDSYQWRKLFWIGCGLGQYILVSGDFQTPRILVCSVCLVTGALGQIRWRWIHSHDRMTAIYTRKAGVSA